MNAAVSDDPPLADGLILAAPAVWGWQTLSPLARKITETAAHVIPWVTVVPTGVHVEASSNVAALRDLARDPLVIKQTRIDTALGLVNLMRNKGLYRPGAVRARDFGLGPTDWRNIDRWRPNA